ncbi:hypothetical protein VHEMI00639 [[Torrubiella] hemipterigena]|uniref:C2H2-type domain-containing protein n=1 Tax=[Torrubiella] hemipterigena TaxID=1531966 RepID=A0A0A1SJS4_9HYPO|nr:hypothetical protein VHEMI00639 [[Torrubiella] hemipterigena]
MWKLISHIESGQCYKFNVKDLEELREKKLAFSRRLLLKNWDTAEPSVLEALIAKSNGPSSRNTIPETQYQQPYEPQGPSVVPGSSKPEAVSLVGTFGSWHTAPVPSPTLPPKAEPPRKSMPKPFQDVQIDVEGCYCELSGRYVCPRASCQRVFKTAKQLLKHLQSPAHSGVSFNCPRCLRTFKSLTEIVSHVELSGPTCPIRSTDDFGAYLDFLTGGLLEVCKESFPDETLKYAVSKDVQELFRIQHQTEPAIDPSEDLIQW